VITPLGFVGCTLTTTGISFGFYVTGKAFFYIFILSDGWGISSPEFSDMLLEFLLFINPLPYFPKCYIRSFIPFGVDYAFLLLSIGSSFTPLISLR